MKTTINVIKPIFIIGAPRSGTTLLYHILCNHRDLSFFTRNILRAGVYRRGRILGYRKKVLAMIQNLLHRDELSVLPHEAPECWSPYLGTYNHLTENECTEEMIVHYSKIIAEVQSIFGRDRFINKNPQHCTRVRILNRIFPDAKFIHIIRNAYAVACSTYYSSSILPSTDRYFGSLRENIFPLLGDKYFSGSLSEIELYKLARDILVANAREARVFGNDRYHEINYEELVVEPREKINEVLAFCELKSYQEFEEKFPKIRNENEKWMAFLGDKNGSKL